MDAKLDVAEGLAKAFDEPKPDDPKELVAAGATPPNPEEAVAAPKGD